MFLLALLEITEAEQVCYIASLCSSLDTYNSLNIGPLIIRSESSLCTTYHLAGLTPLEAHSGIYASLFPACEAYETASLAILCQDLNQQVKVEENYHFWWCFVGYNS